MSHDVRVHIRLGTLRLAYEGSQAFYEAAVEPFVARAAHVPPGGGGRPGVGGRPGRSAAVAAAPGVVHANPGTAAPPPRDPSPAAAAPDAFVPKSPEFGRFLRRLGPEAGEPDRQVVALAFYLWNYERRETFTPHEVRGCFAALGLPAPADLAAILADLTDRKRFVEGAGDGAWRLTKKGENYVKTRLLSA
jgi:hypothetical protein